MKNVDINLKLKDQNENEFTLKDLEEKKVLIFAYPKDGTPGCSVENKQFSDLYEDFKKMGVEVLGVSRDSAKTHQKFCNTLNINLRLIADEKMEFLENLGIVVEKSMFGKKYKTNERSTFLIDTKTGEILKSWEKVNSIGHAANVLKDIEKKEN